MSSKDERSAAGIVRRGKPKPADQVEILPASLPTENAISRDTGDLQPSPSPLVDQALLANFTHQIINPLNGVLGTLHNIIDGTISDARRPQRLKAVYAQLGVTIELVRNLAFLSQLSTQAGRDSLRGLAVDVVVPQLVIEAAQFFQEAADARKMRLILTDRDSQFVVPGQIALLRQVFLNLFENGIKYGTPGTDVIVNIRHQVGKHRLLVEVVNQGKGFDSDESSKLFDLGFRGRHAKALLASGSGLGLYICKQIADLHDAEFTPECSSKLGTVTFRLAFPKFRLDENRKLNESR